MKKSWPLKTFLADTLYFTAGSVLYALALITFAQNAQFAPGGISGLSLIINHFTSWPIGIVALLLNIPLVLLGLRVLGRLFLLKSIYAMLINTLFLDLVFPHLPSYHGNPLLAAMFTGVLLGAGLALIYMRGSSTGGSDFVILSIKKKHPHLSVGRISLCIDGVVILAGGLAFGNVDAVLYGIIASFATTLTLDNVLYGAGAGKLAVVITTRGREVAAAIAAEVDRGATIVPATGAYTGEGRDMLLCACAKNEIYKVRTTAYAVDPAAFVMITEASEVTGEGFAEPTLPEEDTGKKPPAAPG